MGTGGRQPPNVCCQYQSLRVASSELVLNHWSRLVSQLPDATLFRRNASPGRETNGTNYFGTNCLSRQTEKSLLCRELSRETNAERGWVGDADKWSGVENRTMATTREEGQAPHVTPLDERTISGETAAANDSSPDFVIIKITCLALRPRQPSPLSRTAIHTSPLRWAWGL